MKALIDGDVLVYWAANAMQTNEYDIINKKGEVIDTQDSKRHANSSLEGLQGFSNEHMEIVEIVEAHTDEIIDFFSKFN